MTNGLLVRARACVFGGSTASMTFALVALVALALVGVGCGDRRTPGIELPDANFTRTDAGDPTRDSGPGFTDSGIGFGELQITRVVPPSGPFQGGNTAILRGAGFTEEALVTVQGRMVQPADTRLIDDNRLSIVLPAGEVGPGDVTVTVGDEEFTLEDGYTYESISVDPSSGSTAGGTLVNIIGSGTGFTTGDTVTFGREACRDVTAISPTRITCRTPPGAVGTVDVTVTHTADGSTNIARDSFAYFDTADPYSGGLGGGPLNGTLNVTILDGSTGAPIPDATVIVGENLETPYQGNTNVEGQITFSGEDLIGPVTVHAYKYCFERGSFVSFDARDATIFLFPWQDPMCGEGGGGGGGRGRNPSYISGQLIWYGPNEHGPNPWSNVPPPRIGEVKVSYVFPSEPSIDPETWVPPWGVPGDATTIQRVLEDETGDLGYPYRIFVAPRGLAVYALSGLENTETGTFTPYMMGIARNVLVGPGEEAENINIVMNIPLDHLVQVQLEGVPAAVRNGPDQFEVSSYIDLGGEGLVIMRHRVGNVSEHLDFKTQRRNERAFRFGSQPALLGALEDGRYRFEAGWFTRSTAAATPPYTAARETGVADVTTPFVIRDWVGIPVPTAPAINEALPADRVLRWEADGATPTFYMIVLIRPGGLANIVEWRHFVPGNVHEAPIPDLSSLGDVNDITNSLMFFYIQAVTVPGVDFDEFRYDYLYDEYWSRYSNDYLLTSFD